MLAFCLPLAGLLLTSCWPLACLLLASCWPLAGFLLASSFSTRISLENRFFKALAKPVNSPHENISFSMVAVFRGVPPNLGPLPSLLLASCWPLAGFLLASCCPLPGLLLASWFLLSSSFPTRISLENRFFLFMKMLVFQWFRCFVVSAHLGTLAGFFLASCWLPRQSILPEHSARAARQSTPPEHPARASRQS